jgi:antitoxin (DNA-binding transcriptional repressor) of toxin-antitoxin stability system
MKQIAAAAFKKQCLSLLDDVDPDGIVITKDGKPVAKLIPLGPDSARNIGSPDDRREIRGSAVPTGQEWGC